MRALYVCTIVSFREPMVLLLCIEPTSLIAGVLENGVSVGMVHDSVCVYVHDAQQVSPGASGKQTLELTGEYPVHCNTPSQVGISGGNSADLSASCSGAFCSASHVAGCVKVL